MSVLNQLTKPKTLEELSRTSSNIIKIGIDVDGVVANLTDKLLEVANEMYFYQNHYYPRKLKKELKAGDIITFDYTECTPLNNKDMKEIFKVLETEKALLELKPLQDAQKVINKLHESFEIYFVTARAKYYRNAEEQTLGWFDNNKIIYSKSNFFFDNKKTELAKKVGISKFIEDRAETALELAENNIDVLLLNYPRNNDPKQELIQKINKHPKIERIYNIPRSFWFNLEEKLIK